MKQVYVFYVMIFSLLLAVCGCSNDSFPNQETGFISPQDSGTEQRETDKEPVTSDVTEQNAPLPPNIETPDITPPEIVPPLINPPAEIPPVVNPPENIPPLVNLLELNELYTEYSGTKKRTEYIEFKVKQTGNLNGFSLHIMYNGKTPFIYSFPDIDVTLGEYITLHLRTLESGCVNELSADLTMSGGTDSCSTARDLWVSGNDKLLHQTDIVYLLDAYGRFIDAIIMNEAPRATWNKNQSHFTEIVEYLFINGMWKSVDNQMPSPFDAVDTSAIKTATTKSVSRYERKENSHTSNDWYITASSGASPGIKNKE